MKKIALLLISVLFANTLSAQQLNCTVTVNYEKIPNQNINAFKTLQRALNEFVNNTDWTGTAYPQNQRIQCSMFIMLNAFDSDNYTATIQVQSARPVYNSTYVSPVLNFNDKDFSFRYVENENLFFNPNSFDSNLVSTLAFYCYMMIGMDADTFAPQGGSQWFEVAREVANIAQQGGYKGWSQTDGNQNRFFLVNDMLSTTFSPFRQAMYEYHFNGLDAMSRDTKEAKQNVMASIETLAKLHAVRPNAFLTRVFFDAKSDEIVSIFSGGPSVSITGLVDNLGRLSPLNNTKWSSIKF